MCVICIKEMGKRFPSKKSIQNCADSNPDGFAMMWNEGGVVKNYKTLSSREFMGFYKKFIKEHDHKATALVIHARIKTHGSLRIENCHCWTALDGKIGFAHNGILNIKNRADLTDSETYFRDIFLPVYEWSGFDWSVAGKTIDAIIGTSKFAFLTGDGTIHHYGHYIKHEGALYSNSSYQEKVYYTSKNCTMGYTYKGKWDVGKWSAEFYAEKDYMYLNGGRIAKGKISDVRWKLMCNYYFGLMSETDYIAAVLLTERAEKNSVEWWLDEGSYPVSSEYSSYARYFLNKKDWELYVMNRLGVLPSKEYSKIKSGTYGSYDLENDWEDDGYGYSLTNCTTK